MTNDHYLEAAKAAPPLGTLLIWLGGIDLQEWVLAATLLYTMLLVSEKLFKFWRWIHDRRSKHAGSNSPPAR